MDTVLIRNTFREKLKQVTSSDSVITKEAIIVFLQAVTLELKLTGWYITNDELDNKLGLNTRKKIFVAGSCRLARITVNGWEIIFMQQNNEVSSTCLPLLKMLDIISLFKHLPDLDLGRFIRNYGKLVDALDVNQRKDLARFARKYAHFERCVLAMTFKAKGHLQFFYKLSSTLNPVVFQRFQNRLDNILPVLT